MLAALVAVPASAFASSPTVLIPAAPVSLIVKPDGTTATTVTGAPGGKPKVSIAPANSSGLSHNRYEQFSVSRAGVDLDNAISNARLIVNEVTGSAPSHLRGALSVLGPRAHVIVANPNGVSVDGGAFVNTGGVILTTGRVKANASDVDIKTHSGRIEIGGAGIATDGARLDLIAKEIDVAGAIDVQTGVVSLTAGDSVHHVNAQAPIESASGLVQRTGASGRSRSEFAIHVSNPAVINGGTVRLHVTDAGAGVRLAGATVAGAGGFSITSNGHIQMSGAGVQSSGAVSITGATIALTPERAKSSVSSARSGVLLRATSGSIAVAGADLNAVARDPSSFAPLGGVALDAAKDIEIGGSSSGSAVNLTATGDGVALTARGAIRGQNLKLASAGTAILSARDELRFTHLSATSPAFSFLSMSAISLTAPRIMGENGLRLQGASISFDSLAGAQGFLQSNKAGITAVALGGDIRNLGVRLQGYSKTQGDPDSAGGATLIASGDILNKSLDAVRTAAIRADADTLSLNASGLVHNASGSIVSGGDFSIVAGEAIINETSIVGRSDAVLNRRSSFVGLRSEANAAFDYGRPVAGDARGGMTAAGRAFLSARTIENLGAVIHGKDVRAEPSDALVNRSLLTGDGAFSRSCFVFCRATGHLNVNLVESRISGSETVTIKAARTVETSGAQLVAANDVEINTARFSALSILMPMIALRPSGFGGLFQGQDGWFGYGYNGGLVASFYGALRVNANEIQVEGLIINAANGVSYLTTPDLAAVPKGVGPAFRHSVGILSGMLP